MTPYCKSKENMSFFNCERICFSILGIYLESIIYYQTIKYYCLHAENLGEKMFTSPKVWKMLEYSRSYWLAEKTERSGRQPIAAGLYNRQLSAGTTVSFEIQTEQYQETSDSPDCYAIHTQAQCEIKLLKEDENKLTLKRKENKETNKYLEKLEANSGSVVGDKFSERTYL